MQHFIIITSNLKSYPGIFGCPIILSALERSDFKVDLINLYDFGIGKHKKIDEKPVGGGGGLLIRADVIEKAILFIQNKYTNHNILYFCPDPSGEIFNQKLSNEMLNFFEEKNYIKKPSICFLCPRFEGVDSRIFQYFNIKKISIGNFIVSNGDIIVSLIINSIIRQKSIGNAELNSKSESFMDDDSSEFEYDQFTKPKIWNSISVPEVLFSGNHKEIQKWRCENSKNKKI